MTRPDDEIVQVDEMKRTLTDAHDEVYDLLHSAKTPLEQAEYSTYQIAEVLDAMDSEDSTPGVFVQIGSSALQYTRHPGTTGDVVSAMRTLKDGGYRFTLRDHVKVEDGIFEDQTLLCDLVLIRKPNDGREVFNTPAPELARKILDGIVQRGKDIEERVHVAVSDKVNTGDDTLLPGEEPGDTLAKRFSSEWDEDGHLFVSAEINGDEDGRWDDTPCSYVETSRWAIAGETDIDGQDFEVMVRIPDGELATVNQIDPSQ